MNPTRRLLPAQLESAMTMIHAKASAMWRRLGCLLVAGSIGCSGGQLSAEARARLPRSTEPEIEVRTTRKDDTYPVQGASVEQLQRAMLAHSKENWDGESIGRTFVALTADVRCKEYSDGGAIESAVVNLDLLVTLPRWQDRDKAPAELQQRWDKFIAALAAHEEGHVTIAQEHAEGVKPALAALEPQASCSITAEKVQALSARLGRKAIEAEQQFDEATEHGVLQGCQL